MTAFKTAFAHIPKQRFAASFVAAMPFFASLKCYWCLSSLVKNDWCYRFFIVNLCNLLCSSFIFLFSAHGQATFRPDFFKVYHIAATISSVKPSGAKYNSFSSVTLLAVISISPSLFMSANVLPTSMQPVESLR